MGRLNKPAQEGYIYRSPGQTNARDILPNLREDVMASQSADVDRIRRGLDTSETRPQNRAQVQNAAGRAITRTAGRAGLAGLAGEAGYALGRKIDEETGVGKKIVDKSGLGDVAEKAGKPRDKVELSKSAKERLQDEEIDQIRRDTDASEKARRAYSGRYEDGTRLPDDEPYKGDGMKRGGKVKKMASGGMTSKASSASKRGDGIAQRGKTRGKYL
jgi:hypothetical protein